MGTQQKDESGEQYEPFTYDEIAAALEEEKSGKVVDLARIAPRRSTNAKDVPKDPS